MSTTLIIGQPKDATRMAKSSLAKWPTLPIDPVDMVAFAKLLAFISGDKYAKVIDSLVDQTPEQPDVEPWDFENLINPVFLIPERYVQALATLPDAQLAKLAKKWNAIEELQWYKFELGDLEATLASYRDFAAKCLKKKQS